MTPEEFIERAAQMVRTGEVQWIEDGSMVLDGRRYSVFKSEDGLALLVPKEES